MPYNLQNPLRLVLIQVRMHLYGMQPMLQVSGTRHLQIKYQHRSNGQYLSIPDYDRAAEVVLNAADHCNRQLCLSKRQAAQTQ